MFFTKKPACNDKEELYAYMDELMLDEKPKHETPRLNFIGDEL